MLNLKPLYNSPMTLGANPMAVSIVENLTRVSRENQVRHLNTTLEAHQKFATLSSKSPRENGKILVMGSRMAESGAKGGSHGRNSKINKVCKPSQ